MTERVKTKRQKEKETRERFIEGQREKESDFCDTCELDLTYLKNVGNVSKEEL